MCTLSFIPGDDGFLVGMNRDELLSRGSAEPPSVHEIRGVKALYPTDVEGGAWIAATEFGNTFAILNRNGGDPRKKRQSRGALVTGVLGSAGFSQVESSMKRTDLAQFLPFRLIAIFASTKQVYEWIWDGRKLSVIELGWQSRHWFSSGISDEQATRSRSQVFESGWKQPNAGERDWLRRVHRSHGETAGAFSICVHRDDAASVSYTEVSVNRSEIAMSYSAGSPCQNAAIFGIVIPRLQTVSTL